WNICLYWYTLISTLGISYFFSSQRIKSLEAIARAHERLQAAFDENEKKNIQMSSLYTTARQVAHDIRSPVMALEMVSGSLSESDVKRKDVLTRAIQRINDIADDLLSTHRSMQGITLKTTSDVSSLNE